MIDWNVNVKDLSDRELKRLHDELHDEYDSRFKEQFFNLHRRIVREMKRRGIKHPDYNDELDSMKLKQNINIDKLKHWTEDTAYFFGWLITDGSIIDTPTEQRVSFQLRPEDDYILKHFKKYLEYTGDIRFTKKFPYSTLTINNIELVEYLKSMGLGPQKEVSPKFIRDVPDKVFNHFVRGVFDANGSFSWTPQGLIARVSGRETPMRALFSRLKEKGFNVHWFDADRTQGFSLYDSYAIEFAKWLYKGASIYLKRKKEVVKDQLYAIPRPSGEELGEQIELKQILSYLAQGDMALAKPFVILTGGLVNHGKTKGDIDILIRASENDSLSTPIQFRILRLLPKELWNRVQFIFEKEQDSVGPFTSHIPLFDLELKLREDLNVIEMSQLEFNTTEKPVEIFLVGAEKKPFANMFEGVMLNSYTLKSRSSLEPWIDTYEGKIMLDNGAFQANTLTPQELNERVHEIQPHYVVAPDDIFSINSHEITLKHTKKFLELSRPEHTKVIVVPQGQTVQRYEWCIREMIKLEPDSIGLGRMSMKVAQYPGTHFQQRLVALDRLNEHGLLDEIRDAGIEMHSLGISNPHEFKYLNYYGFKSADSMSYIYSAMYRQLPLPDEPDERPFTFDGEGNVKKKPFDTAERYMLKQELAKKFLSLNTMDEKCQFVLQIWKEIRKLVATQDHIDRHVAEHKGFDPSEIEYVHIDKPDTKPSSNKSETNTKLDILRKILETKEEDVLEKLKKVLQ